MTHHDYREEPNVRFAPDKTMVFFTSNLFGASYVFGVEVKKAENPAAADVKDTAEPGAAVEAAGSGAGEVG
jgi:oligogalacturonide lyase